MGQSIAIKEFPKIELHCHLDGSVSPQTLQKIAGDKNSLAVEEFLKNQKIITRPEGAGDLATYLKCFDVVLPYLQTEEALRTAAYELIAQVSQEQVLYIEVRFAPLFHCKMGLEPARAVNAVIQGLELGERDFGVSSRVLLCMMRGQDEAFNEKTLQCAREMRNYGVAGLDLAGNEAAYPPELYQRFFDQAREWDIPFTIHAGECQSAQNVRTSIEMGAKRIGHGIALAHDEKNREFCREKKIVLEMCPVSNLQTGAVKAIQDYPFQLFRESALGVTINTDNRAVSGTTLTKDWTLLDNYFQNIDEQTMFEAGMNAIQGAFLPSKEKEKLKIRFLEKAEHYKMV